MNDPDITGTMAVDTRVVIIGAGFSGMCAAIKLQEAGIDDFRILEKADEVGGTWRENTYPGAECDVPSALYSYSFEHNPEWRHKWSKQAQIFAYQKNIALKYGLYEKIDFGVAVSEASFDEAVHSWLVSTVDGASYRCQHLIAAVGQLHRPMIPDLAGLDQFDGAHFHSAQWDHSVELAGKRVAVIGNAASALQFIPEIAEQAAQLDVYQRSANWVLPKGDRPYHRWEQWVSEKLGWLTKLYRLRLWLRGEWVFFPALKGWPLWSWWARRMFQKNLEELVADPELRGRLTPDYPIGAKRILFSDNYYQALVRDNVQLITGDISSFTESGIVCEGHPPRDYDVAIFATGFSTNPFLAPMKITGMGGKSLSEHWRQGAQAYLGITTHGFPNFFMLYGPNTNLGHTSILIMAEAQSKFIAQCISGLSSRDAKSLTVRQQCEEEYNRELQARLARLSWSQVAASWYMDRGRITNNWAGSTYEYRKRTARVDWDNFDLT